jgi:hypothetical protein
MMIAFLLQRDFEARAAQNRKRFRRLGFLDGFIEINASCSAHDD